MNTNFPLSPLTKSVYQESSPIPKKGILKLREANKTVGIQKKTPKRHINFDRAYQEKPFTKRKQRVPLTGKNLDARMLDNLKNTIGDLLEMRTSNYFRTQEVLEELKEIALGIEDYTEDILQLNADYDDIVNEMTEKKLNPSKKNEKKKELIEIRKQITGAKKSILELQNRMKKDYFRDPTVLTVEEIDEQISQNNVERANFRNDFADMLKKLEVIIKEPPSPARDEKIWELKTTNHWFATLINKMLLNPLVDIEGEGNEKEMTIEMTKAWIAVPELATDLVNAKKDLSAFFRSQSLH